MLVVLGGARSCQHGNSPDSTVETSRLLKADGRARDLEIAIAKRDIVQTFNDGVNDLVVRVLAEGNTLDGVSWKQAKNKSITLTRC